MALTYFSFVMGLYGVGFWMPTLIKGTGVQSPLIIGLLTAIPNVFAVIGMFLISRSSDRKRERRWHLALPAIFGALGLAMSAVWGGNTTLAMVALTVANIGICTVLPLFWSRPTAILGGTGGRGGDRDDQLGWEPGGFRQPLSGGLAEGQHGVDQRGDVPAGRQPGGRRG